MIPLGGSGGIHDKVTVLSVVFTIVSDLGAVGPEETHNYRNEVLLIIQILCECVFVSSMVSYIGITVGPASHYQTNSLSFWKEFLL